MKITLSVYLLSQLKIFTVVLRLWGRTVQGQGESCPEGETSWGWGETTPWWPTVPTAKVA